MARASYKISSSTFLLQMLVVVTAPFTATVLLAKISQNFFQSSSSGHPREFQDQKLKIKDNPVVATPTTLHAQHPLNVTARSRCKVLF